MYNEWNFMFFKIIFLACYTLSPEGFPLVEAPIRLFDMICQLCPQNLSLIWKFNLENNKKVTPI